METLADRIAWILEHRINPETGKPWKHAQHLGVAAKLKSPAHVRMIRNGTIKAPGVDTLEPIARTAGVSFEWLQRGVGRPDDAAPARAVDELVRYRELSGWSDLLAAARILRPGLPEWVWQKVGSMRYELDAPATQSTVAGAAQWVMENERVYKPRSTTDTGAHAAAARKGVA